MGNTTWSCVRSQRDTSCNNDSSVVIMMNGVTFAVKDYSVVLYTDA